MFTRLKSYASITALLSFFAFLALWGSLLQASPIEDKISFTISNSTLPPDDTSNWQPITLPDQWGVEHQGQQGITVWYRIKKQISSKPSDNWSFLIERLNMNAAVFIGQQFLGDGGTFKEPIARNWVRPLLFNIPSSLLKEGENTIYIRLIAYSKRGGGFRSYQFAPSQTLKETYNFMFFHYITASQTICFTLILFACLMFFFWLINWQHTEYLWLAVASLSGAMFPANMFVQDIPVTRGIWVWAVQTGIGWFVWSILMTFHRYFDIRKPKLEKVVTIYALVGSIILFFVPNDVHQFAVLLWQSMFIILATYIMLLTGSEWYKHRDKLRLGWMLGYAIMYATAVHDWSLIVITKGYFFEIYYHFGTFALILLSSLVMLGRFARSLNNTQQLNFELSGKVDQLEADEQKLSAVNNERQRIMRDLHDGLGNTLVSAIALSKGAHSQESELQSTLRDAMSEMRLIVDSEIHTSFNFENALFSLKKRIELTLSNSNTQLEWSIESLTSITLLHNPYTGSHLIRILQEGLTNAIKHSGASKITVFSNLKADTLELTISDNGEYSAIPNTGNGLKNMRSRAKELGASLSITNNKNGSTILLSLPLDT